MTGSPAHHLSHTPGVQLACSGLPPSHKLTPDRRSAGSPYAHRHPHRLRGRLVSSTFSQRKYSLQVPCSGVLRRLTAAPHTRSPVQSIYLNSPRLNTSHRLRRSSPASHPLVTPGHRLTGSPSAHRPTFTPGGRLPGSASAHRRTPRWITWSPKLHQVTCCRARQSIASQDLRLLTPG